MNKLGLFLDDERNPEDVTWIDYPKDIKWIIVRSLDTFIFYLDHAMVAMDYFDYVSFDNDLGENQGEGKDAAKNLCYYYDQEWELNKINPPFPTCFIHSQNNQAAEYIKSILASYIKIAAERPKT